MLHIALVSTSFPLESEGSAAAGSFVHDFAVELCKHAKVTVIAPGSGEDPGVAVSSMRILRFLAPKLPLSLLKANRPRHWSAIARTLSNGKKAMRALAEEDPPDHILAFWVLPSGYWARSAAVKRGIPYSTWALGSDIWDLGKLPVIRSMLASVLKDASFRFADGIQLKEDVEKLSGHSCQFLPSCRDLPVKPKEPRTVPPYRLAFLGRWHPNKGIDLLLEMLEQLSPGDWALIDQVRIFGGGPLENHVKETCRSLEHAGCPVKFGGFIGKEDAAELLAWADYLIIPSRIESIPVIFSDALQAGCPMVTTPVGDLPALMDQYKVGLMADEVSTGSLLETVQRALRQNPADYSPALKSARHAFSVSASVDTFMRHITQANHKTDQQAAG